MNNNNNLGTLNLEQLEKLCGNSVRRVKAILEKNENGFALFAQVGGLTHPIVDESGRQITFTAIEHAIARLVKLSNRPPEVRVKLSQFSNLPVRLSSGKKGKSRR